MKEASHQINDLTNQDPQSKKMIRSQQEKKKASLYLGTQSHNPTQ